MTRISCFLLIVVSLISCRARPADVIELAPATEAATTPEPDPPKIAVETPGEGEPTDDDAEPTRSVWTTVPPYDGRELRLERIGDDHVRIVGERFAIELPLPTLGDCVDKLPEPAAPPELPEGKVRSKPAWVSLIGDVESASLRLGTHDALIVINDGCMRFADVTHLLLGTEPAIEDPVFTLEVEPESASDTDGMRLRRSGSNAKIQRDRKTLVEVKGFFSPESMLTAREADEQQWIRLLMSREWEYKRNDGTSGRDHTLVWSLGDDEEPFLVLNNDYRYGFDGRDREERNIKSTRAYQHPDGVFQAAGKRKVIEKSVRVGDECADADGDILLRDFDDTVRWTFRPEGAKRAFTLGTARMKGVYSTGCVEAASKKVKRRGLALAARAIKSRVDWKTP